jgi:hypothetical protein
VPTYKTEDRVVAAATASVSPKSPDRNQDRVLTFAVKDPEAGVGAVLCDGVGAYSGSGEVAAEVTEIVADHVQKLGPIAGVLSSADAAAACIDSAADGATTLIAIGANTRGELAYAFVGNGSLFEVQVELGATAPILRAAELVLPHVSLSQGRPVLTSYIPMPPGVPLEVSAGRREADAMRIRLLLACSDGVATHEDRKVGVVAPAESKWLEIPRPLADVFDAIAERWEALLCASDSEAYLDHILRDTLETLNEEGVLEDDASLAALLVCPPAGDTA